jgi:secreted trypsin-like serine protease
MRKRWAAVAIAAISIAGVFGGRYVIQIVHGVPVNISSYPFVVSLEDGTGLHQCAGALLGERWVLTAGHCQVVPDAQVRANSDRLGPDAVHQGGDVRKVESRCLHYKFAGTSGAPVSNDLQLLKVASFGAATPARVARPGVVHRSAFHLFGFDPTVRVLGWGRTESGSYPDQLHQVTVATVTDSTCSAEHKNYKGKILPEHLCFGETPKGTCHGDSGGPVLNRWNSDVVAIVSGPGGGACGAAQEWTVGAEIIHYNAWITKVMGGDTTECMP